MMWRVIPAFLARPRWRAGHALGQSVWRWTLAALTWLILSTATVAAQSVPPMPPVPGEVTVSTANGFARLLFRFRSDMQASMQMTGSILIVSFRQPVDIDVDRLNTSAPDYISAARRDPDGMAVRIALARKIKPNLMPAGERLFVDLLPDTWTGLLPGLPQDVVEELARRVREAEKRARMQQQLTKWKKVEPTRVHVATQPTFTRYMFPLTSNISVASDRGRDGLTLVFDAPLRFDLADAFAALPPFITGIEPKLDEDAASVHFAFNGKVDVRTFREDSNYVVDLSATSISKPRSDPISRVIDESAHAPVPQNLPPRIEGHAPETVPAIAAPAANAEAARPPSRAPPLPTPRAPSPKQEAKVSPVAPPAPAPAPSSAAPSPPVRAAEGAAAAPPMPASRIGETARPPQATTPAVAPPAPKLASAPEPSPNSSPKLSPKPRPAALAPAASPGGTPAASKGRSVKVEVKRLDNSVRLFFPFATATPAAVFRRADAMWLVFDSDVELDLNAVQPRPNAIVRGMHLAHHDGLVLRLKLDRPRLGSLTAEGTGWALVISDQIADPSQPIPITRNIVGPNRASVIIPFEGAQRLHRLSDPDVGDTLLVVTALAPVRGMIKPHDFVEFHALATTQGIAIQPLADDILIQVTPDRVGVGRPEGLTLSAHVSDIRASGGNGSAVFDIRRWNRDRTGNFTARQSELFNAAVKAPAEQQTAVHVNLARFYLAREMYPEAKAAMDMAIAAAHSKVDDAVNYVLRAVAKVMSQRPVDALQDLAHSSVGNQYDAPLWRAVAHAEQRKWVEARKGFQEAQMSIGTLPIELQRFVLRESVSAAIEVGDYDSAGDQLNDFETIGASPEMQPTLAVLRGRVSEKLGHTNDAIADYELATGSIDRRAATQARLRLAVVRMNKGELNRKDAIAELETVSVIWRGDQTEIETLQLLARLYTEAGRVRDALGVMRAALAANARSDVTRRIQDEAAETFESLFLSGKGKALPAIDALSLFYDFRDLTPMGRRGDEMIRRLADRLVSVDLLDQASELLQHQVDHRLEGAARAQVAARLAMVYLMNHKPDRALRALRSTHVSGLSNMLRNRRLLLESRALSELGRPDVALEIVANIHSREADRLRADVLWHANRWRKAAEQIERLLGERWRDWQPLNAVERTDVLRAAIGYALSEETLGLDRLRERYAAKMTDGPDRHAFDVVTGPSGVRSAEFRTIASTVGSLDTLDAFLRDMRTGFPELGVEPPHPPAAVKAAAPAPSLEKEAAKPAS
jgi:tetratricopeptide (TPR) repeat protein